MLFVPLALFAQAQRIKIVSSYNGLPVAFAAVKYEETGRGTIADLDGYITLDPEQIKNIRWVEVSCVGYKSQKLQLPISNSPIVLQPSDNTLKEVVVKTNDDKIRRILRSAVNSRNTNNPDKYDWYSCYIYYKMKVDVDMTESLKNDTGKEAREIREFTEKQHLLMSETYSKRTWQQPQKLQEEVLGTRFSGLKKSVFTSMVTDVLPFHSYNDYISLNGKDYHNPVSAGWQQYYKYALADEILVGGDTLWMLKFKPTLVNAGGLKGSVYISSKGYAIANLKAVTTDTLLKRVVGIEQEYSYITDTAAKVSHWFPHHLNFFIDWTLPSGSVPIQYHITGNSQIDTVSFVKRDKFHFDKAHTIKIQEGADIKSDKEWLQLRPIALDAKEQQTYTVIDSIGEKFHLDRYTSYLSGLPAGKVPIGPVDLDITRILRANYYENFRLGIGGQTNDKVSKWFSLGGWAGYGFKDVRWKYGAFAEFYPFRDNKETVLKIGYSEDLFDPGRVRMHPDLDKMYLRAYLLRKVDLIKMAQVQLTKKLGYWSLGLAAQHQEILPQYVYAYDIAGKQYTSYKANEAVFSIRYAFAERTAPFFGKYYSVGSKYPILYAKFTAGNLYADQLNIEYYQINAALAWKKHINRIGSERIQIQSGISFSNHPLPVSKLFAANGFRADGGKGGQSSIYTFGGLLTVYPYEYYSDRYLNIMYRHDFDWKLFNYNVPHSKFGFGPNLALQYNVLVGNMQDRQVHSGLDFKVPDNAYHEAGLILNNILRMNYLDFYYLTLNVGYFQHITEQFDSKQDGKLVLGIGVEF